MIGVLHLYCYIWPSIGKYCGNARANSSQDAAQCYRSTYGIYGCSSMTPGYIHVSFVYTITCAFANHIFLC